MNPDELAQEHIEFIEAQLIVVEVENELLKERIVYLEAVEIEHDLMVKDRNYCP